MSGGLFILNWIAVKYFSLEQDLQELSDYLRARGLQHRITEEQGQQCLWVLDERVVPALQEFLAQYSQGDIRLEPAPVTESTVYSQPSLLQQVIHVPIVVGLIALSSLGYFLQQGMFGFTLLNAITFAPLEFSYSNGELWRILTPVFLHFSVLHVVFNCMCVWDLGRRLELFFGSFHFAIFFVVTSIAANLVQFAWSGSVSFGGISGFICAMFGFITVRRFFDSHPLINVPLPYISFMFLWLALCVIGVIDYVFNVSIANAAHLGGLIAGALYALATTQFFRR